MILTSGLVKTEVAVLTVTTLTLPSSPVCRAVMRARGHLVGGATSLRKRQSWPTLGVEETLHHLGRSARL